MRITHDESYTQRFLRKRRDHVIVVCNDNPIYWEEGTFSYILTSMKELEKDPFIAKGCNVLYVLTQKGVQYEIK